MQIAVAIGGYALSEADILRKVMSKKKTEEMEGKEKPKFLAGARKKKIPESKGLKDMGTDGDLWKYGFQQFAQHRLCDHFLSDGLSESPLPGGIHGGAC